MEKIKKMKYVLPVLGISCLCALTSINAATVHISAIPALGGSDYKEVVKDTSAKNWSAKFNYHDGTYNHIFLTLCTPTGSLYDSMLVTEGAGVTQKSYTKNVSANSKVRVYYRDYDKNFARYTCDGDVNVN